MPTTAPTLDKLTPINKVPVLVLDDGWKIPESTIIVEYLDSTPSGPRLIPDDRDLARQTRFHDRIADLYVTEPLGTIVREPDATERVAEARKRIEAMFAGIDAHLAKRTWLMGDTFTLADCSLIPPLTRYRSAHPFDRWKHLSAYLDARARAPVGHAGASRAGIVRGEGYGLST